MITPARSFHAGAWVLWLCGSATAVLAIQNPAASLVALVALGAVAASFARGGPEGRAFALMLGLGVAFLGARVVLSGLTGHTGDTVLVTLPELVLPAWLGGFGVGGRITAEVLAQAAAEGITIVALLGCFGVFLSCVPAYRVLRLLPRFLFEAGLVVAIALAFVPTILRAASDVRDAQRLRGHRFRGVRSVAPLVLPVLGIALERSLTLAASLDARGYGRVSPGAGADARARAAVLGGVLCLAAGGGFAAYGRGVLALALGAAGGLATAAGLHAVGAEVSRTRMRRERADSFDLLLGGVGLLLAAAAIAARSLPSSDWYPYPVLRLPALDPRSIAIAAAVAAPVAIDALRTMRLARASERQQLPAEAAR